MTLQQACRQAAKAFAAAGIPDPAWDSGLLMERATGIPPLMARLSQRELTEAEHSTFAALCQRRLQREPLQYILGEQSFLGRSFHVDSRVLIPRPETELLAERAIAALKRFQDAPRALDLCCGSGCLGASLALEVPEARVEAADLSPEALAVAKDNAQRLGAPVTFLQGDLWQAVTGRCYDLIVSNPPYIPNEACETLQPEVMREPAMALRGGADGLDFYRRIAAGVGEHLLPGGVLFLEVGYGQAAQVADMLGREGLKTECHQDYQGILRMVEAWRK